MEQSIGRYQIIEKIGKGAMATVYKAFDPGINRDIAIKVLREARANDKEYRSRFLREAKAAGNLTHPNIVTVFDAGEADDRPYMAMELLEGQSLDNVMASGERMPLADIIVIGIQLAKALDYAHGRGVVHRDIKPSNIVVVGDSNTVKITDFGIAHMESADVTEQTQLGAVLGTPQYMSPEQVMGRKIDGRSDLFSVGVILYQLVAGVKPFAADTLSSLFMQIVNEEPTPVKDKAHDIPPALAQTINKLLRKDPEKRFHTGKQLAAWLSRILREVEERAAEGGSSRIIPIRVKWTALMAAIVTTTMLIGLGFVYKQQHESMGRLALDYGSSLSSFIAAQSAEPLLIEDWIAIETFVDEVKGRRELSHLTIIDHKGVVRGSTNPEVVGQPFEAPRAVELVAEDASGKVFERTLSNKTKVLDFDRPITFQNKTIGRIRLGLSQSSLLEVSKLMIVMMLVLMVVTVGAVIVVAYVLGHHLSKPIRTLKRSLREMAEGHYGHRIADARNDEFGQLFVSFNRMAEAVQQADEDGVLRQTSSSLVALAPGPEPMAEPATDEADGTRENEAPSAATDETETFTRGGTLETSIGEGGATVSDIRSSSTALNTTTPTVPDPEPESQDSVDCDQTRVLPPRARAVAGGV